jgi:hypothetical protein
VLRLQWCLCWVDACVFDTIIIDSRRATMACVALYRRGSGAKIDLEMVHGQMNV